MMKTTAGLTAKETLQWLADHWDEKLLWSPKNFRDESKRWWEVLNKAKPFILVTNIFKVSED